MYFSGGNATDLIWRVLASSDGISFWTPLKPQHSNPNPNLLAYQLWYIDFLTPPSPLIIPHRLPGFLESLMPLKNWCSIHARCSKSSLKHSIRFCGILFSSLKQNFIAYCSSKVSSSPDWIFAIHQLWQSDFSRVYSNCCCSCWFEPEILKIGQSSHKMYSNNIVNFLESTTILNACTKRSGNLLNAPGIYHHHHDVMPSVRISLTLFCHFSLSFIASGRSSGLHSVSSQSYCMYVRAGRSAFARPYVRVHRSTSLMNSSLLLQQCPACLVCLTWIVFVMGGRWLYSWCFVGCLLQDLFKQRIYICVCVCECVGSRIFSRHTL